MTYRIGRFFGVATLMYASLMIATLILSFLFFLAVMGPDSGLSTAVGASGAISWMLTLGFAQHPIAYIGSIIVGLIAMFFRK